MNTAPAIRPTGTPYPVHVDAPKPCDKCADGEAEDWCDECGEWACGECADQREQPAGKSYARAILIWICHGCHEER